MNNQRASSSSSKEDAIVIETPPIQRALMPAWLFWAAVKGDIEVFESGMEETDGDAHLKVTIDVSRSSSNQNTKKVPMAVEDLQSVTHMGNTVLHILVTYGRTNLVYTICQKDRSMWRVQNKMLETPFYCAAKVGHDKTISELIEFARSEEDQLKIVLRKKSKHGETALHEATRRGYSDVVCELMEVDPLLACEFNDDGVSPLYLAAARATRKYDSTIVEKMMNQLSKHNIDPVYTDGRNKKNTRDGALSSVGTNERVIQTPTSVVKSTDISKIEPIHLLASTGMSSVVKLILQGDSSLAYLPDSEGYFPIHLAAQAGNVEVIALFMIMFPDSCELLDYRGRNFFHVAAEENMSEVFAKLMLAYEKKKLFTKVKDESMDNLLNNNMNEIFIRMINETDNDGNTPLHLAAEKGCKSVIEFIWIIGRSNKVKKKIVDTYRKSGISMEVLKKRDFLVYGYVDLGLRNKKGLTPFDISTTGIVKSADNPLAIKERIKQYIEIYGAQFTLNWSSLALQIGEGKEPTDKMDKLQLIGLGAVLITTVAFAVAFTLPGGYGSNGSPLLGRQYIFKAFILADTLAFIMSALCVTFVIYDTLTFRNYSDRSLIGIPLVLLSVGVKCMVLAFGLGLYLMLAPISKEIGILILTLILLTVVLETVMILRPYRHSRYGWRLVPSYAWAGVHSGSIFCCAVLFIFLFALLS